LPAAKSIVAPNSAEIAPQRYPAGKNHAFCRPPKSIAAPNSAEIAFGDFSQ
jgi:hypothetical protein